MTDARDEAQLERIRKEADRTADGPDENPVQPDIPPDRTRQFRHVNFSRLRTEWRPQDRLVIDEIRRQAQIVMNDKFRAAFALMDRIYMTVRVPVHSDGEIAVNSFGHPIWQLNEFGDPIEDWTVVGDEERYRWIHEITIHLFEWEQAAAILWGDAMFAKGIWEEVFARGFTELPKGTIDDKTQTGHLAGMEDRYFAIFQSLISRRADAVVRSMDRICQRLKDTAKI